MYIWHLRGCCNWFTSTFGNVKSRSVFHSHLVLLQNNLYGHLHQQLHQQNFHIFFDIFSNPHAKYGMQSSKALWSKKIVRTSQNPKGQAHWRPRTQPHTEGLPSRQATWQPSLRFQRRYKDSSPDSQGSGPTSQVCLTICSGRIKMAWLSLANARNCHRQTRWTTNLWKSSSHKCVGQPMMRSTRPVLKWHRTIVPLPTKANLPTISKPFVIFQQNWSESTVPPPPCAGICWVLTSFDFKALVHHLGITEQKWWFRLGWPRN